MSVEARDDVGILQSADLYAKKSCNTCYGRGVVQMMQPISTQNAMELIAANPANEGFIFQRKPGSYSTKRASMCGCARSNYMKKRDRYINLLVSEGLARVIGSTVNETGDMMRTVELL